MHADIPEEGADEEPEEEELDFSEVSDASGSSVEGLVEGKINELGGPGPFADLGPDSVCTHTATL